MAKTSDSRAPGRPRRTRGFWFGLVGGSLAGALATGAVLALAAFASAGFGHGGHGFGHGGRHVEWATGWVLSEVDATPEQETRILAIVAETQDAFGPLAEQHHANHAAFEALLRQPELDRTALEELRAAELGVADDASALLLGSLVDAADVLTPEQRVELFELHDRFHR